MNNERLLEKINTACNILDSVRAELINNERTTKKKGNKKNQSEENAAADPVTKGFNEMSELNQELTIKQLLEKYGQPTDTEHLESVHSIVNANGITRQQLEECLQRICAANEKEPKNSIQKYTYSCLHKINRA